MKFFDGAVAAEGEAMVAKATTQYAALAVTAALDTIWEYVRRLNRLVEEEAPWKLARDEAQAGRLDAVLNGLAAGMRLVALALYPVALQPKTQQVLSLVCQCFAFGKLRT